MEVLQSCLRGTDSWILGREAAAELQLAQTELKQKRGANAVWVRLAIEPATIGVAQTFGADDGDFEIHGCAGGARLSERSVMYFT